jgi:hypothetical protein
MSETRLATFDLIVLGNFMNHFVVKLVKSFGRLDDVTESLDDFR